MKCYRIGLPLLALALGASAAAAQQGTVDAGLRRVMRPDVRASIRDSPRLGLAVPVEEQPLGGSIALEKRTAVSPARVGVLARLSTPGAADELRAAGAEIGVIVGDIATAWVPLDALDRVAAVRGVERIEAARVVETVNDTSMIAIQADMLRQQSGGIWTGATGHGVLVGIYDTGLDLHHEDFRDNAGNTRVVALWDQANGVQRPPAGFTQGLFCSEAQIQARLDTNSSASCPQTDPQGHGTHVTGTAAGDGSAAGGAFQYRFAGVAPNADLIIVRGGPGVFFENLIIEGLAFIKGAAAARQQPVVVNLSLGGQYGAHDGSRLYEQAIDQLSGPGFIVVIAAGNFGSNLNTLPVGEERLIHARGVASGLSAVEFEFELCRSGVTTSCAPYSASSSCAGNAIELNFWYDGADRLGLELVRPDGSSVAASRGSVNEGTAATGHITVDNGAQGVNPDNGDVEALLIADSCGPSGPPAAGTWKIRVTPEVPGSGRPYDMWIVRSAIGFNGVSRGRTGFDNRHIVASPGNATRAITVGAYTSRVCWTGQSGIQVCYVEREQIGDVARFSGAGPRRDGVLKPEIVAPGVGVISSRSSTFFAGSNATHPDGNYYVNAGTSMSAPHVTGAIAVLLQANALLTPEAVKTAFLASAIQDGFTGRVYGTAPGASPSDWWGFGKLNVRDALLSLGSIAPAVLAVSAQPVTPDTAVLSRRGSRLSLLELMFESRGDEAITVLGLTFDLTGRDPGARLLLVRDVNDNGLADPAEPVLGSAPAPLTGVAARVQLGPDSLEVPASGTTTVLVALELSGEGPHGGAFEAALLANATLSIGTRSLARNPLELGTVIASGLAGTSVLRSDQLLSLSENPVRGASVHFLFAERPSAAAIYTVSGRLVIDLLPELATDLRVEWTLANDRGARVAPGIYLLVFTVSGETFREKLMVLTSGGAPPEDRE